MMRSSEDAYAELDRYYTIAVDSICKIAGVYHALGKAADARSLLHHSLQLVEGSGKRLLLKLLLQYGKILVIEYVYTNQDADGMFSVITKAKRIAEEIDDRRGIADALSLLGAAHYFVTLNNSMAAADSQQNYDEALACQLQALEHRKALDDTRGISESNFLIGNVYERRQQGDTAVEYYKKAWEIADQYGHLNEKTEPARHFAYYAVMKGNLNQALSYALEALSLREESGFRPYLPLDHLLLSDIYIKLGDEANALIHTQRAYVLAEEMGYKRALASALISLGDMQVDRKEEKQAKANYEKALDIAQELRLPMSIARANERLERLAAP
ncbi:tetratricopeptide repeat protein [Paenibacillus sp. sptzw28]|uniref:tetratricopeptide repeat protein n=1 Tax=Paenibacillus sp. sptzw28 TaxID=715179 RepID=UPI001C6DE9FF|nr:tetratricopeptide repeat protein [Paenibacillus sp. sptzw28]QYR22893.1 tetratricopeptide repeat protein [Paenibacillus sp. sptzw28]